MISIIRIRSTIRYHSSIKGMSNYLSARILFGCLLNVHHVFQCPIINVCISIKMPYIISLNQLRFLSPFYVSHHPTKFHAQYLTKSQVNSRNIHVK